MTIPKAILLLGPTGSGKTPLGHAIEERGLGGHTCLHFDFGANLREIVAREEPAGKRHFHRVSWWQSFPDLLMIA